MTQADPASIPEHPRYCRRTLFALIALCILILAVYANSLDCSWHFDDDFNIKDNPNVHMRDLSWDAIRQAVFSDRNKPHMPYRPVAGLTFALNHYFGKLNVFGYHVVNLSVHAVTAAFLFLLLYRILNLDRIRTRYRQGPYFAALLAAVFWAVNPLNTQAVTYIVQRMAALAAMFSVIAMYFYLRARTSVKRSPRRALFAGSALSFLLAVGSKENAAMLPAGILALEAFILQDDPGRFFRRHWAKMAVVFLFTLGLGTLYLYVKTGNIFSFIGFYEARPFTLGERLLTQPRVIFFYLSLFFYPMPQRLNIAHDFSLSTSLFSPMTTFFSLLALVGLLATSFLYAKRQPLWSFPILFFFLNHVVESTVFPLELVFEHRNYLPTVFLFLPLAVGIANLLQRPDIKPAIRWVILGGLVLILVGLGHSTFMRNFAWKNEFTLWMDASEKAPGQFRAHHNLAKCYQDRGLVKEALVEYEKALTCPVGQRRDEMIVTYYNLGKLHADQGRIQEGELYYNKAIAMSPVFIPALTNLAGIYDRRGDLEKARLLLVRILTVSPGDQHAHLNMAIYYLKTDDPEKALLHLVRSYDNKAIKAEAAFYLGVTRKLLGSLGSAVVALQQAVTLGVRKTDAHLHLAEALLRAGLPERAERHVETALEILRHDEAHLRRIIKQIQEQKPFKALQPSAALIMPLMGKVCEKATAAWRERKTFIEEVMNKVVQDEDASDIR